MQPEQPTEPLQPTTSPMPAQPQQPVTPIPAAPVEPATPQPTFAMQPPAPIGTQPQPTPAGGFASKGGNGVAKKGSVAGSIIALVIAAATLGYNYLYIPSLSKVSMNDLTETTAEGTAFKYPKQWKQLDTKKTYGDQLGKDATNSALVAVEKSTYINAGVSRQPESTVSKMRQQVTTGLTDTDIKENIAGYSDCKNVTNIEKSEYTNKSDKTVGIAKLSAECTKDSETFKLVMVLTLGDDGYLRSGLVAATTKNWRQNEAVYNAMLDSIKQSS
jgi:hypothetical protein